jgi:predicted secreted acid phosphatase
VIVRALVVLAVLLACAGVALADEPAAPASPEAIVAYHDSGEWSADTTQVVRRARRYVRRHLDDSSRRAAIVLDIDDTSLSNYECLKAVGFDRSAADCGAQTLPAIPQTRSLFRWARDRGVAVFFITGRREEARARTAANLRAAGYRGGWTLKLRPDSQPRRWRDGWKARVRRAIVERRGFRILANVGDQWSDLDGGWSARRFKLPNPMYVIPTA